MSRDFQIIQLQINDVAAGGNRNLSSGEITARLQSNPRNPVTQPVADWA